MIQGAASYRRLSTCHADLQRLVVAAAAEWEIIVVCGHRGEQDQNAAVRNGTSRLRWPHSRHNSTPSEAVDLAPFPLDWEDLGRFDSLARHVLGVAESLGIAIEAGAFWPRFVDRPHFGLTERSPVAA